MMWYQNLIIDFIADNAIGNLSVSDRTALLTADLFTPSVCLINLICILSGRYLSCNTFLFFFCHALLFLAPKLRNYKEEFGFMQASNIFKFSISAKSVLGEDIINAKYRIFFGFVREMFDCC